jgi:hypothetical protein
LSLISAKGTDSPLVFFDAREYPKACKISGAYTQDGVNIELNIKIRCGEVVQKHSLSANNKEELVHKIIELME